ncbi:hypothetical protein N9L92_00415 [Saprospiraceae bacterium]|nr:hypothetical protein [Saprospiraceae bacterium]
MKYLLILTLASLLISCSSNNDDECQTCYVVTESNHLEAEKICNGEPNNYPDITIIEESEINANNDLSSEFCGEAIAIYESTDPIVVEGDICGVLATTTTYFRCR